jgi:hypothetical protein
MIKAYVATKFERKTEARELMADLGRLGVSITHDWTVFENGVHPASDCAIHDTNGVLDCDFVVILANDDLPYRGSYVEFGIALGTHKKIYLIGNGMDRCIFANHPDLKRFSNKKEFLSYFKKTYKR